MPSKHRLELQTEQGRVVVEYWQNDTQASLVSWIVHAPHLEFGCEPRQVVVDSRDDVETVVRWCVTERFLGEERSRAPAACHARVERASRRRRRIAPPAATAIAPTAPSS